MTATNEPTPSRDYQLAIAIADAYDSFVRNALIDSARLALGTNERIGAYMRLLQSTYVRNYEQVSKRLKQRNDDAKQGTPGRMSRDEIRQDIYDLFIWDFRQGLYELIDMTDISEIAQLRWTKWVNRYCDDFLFAAVNHVLPENPVESS